MSTPTTFHQYKKIFNGYFNTDLSRLKTSLMRVQAIGIEHSHHSQLTLEDVNSYHHLTEMLNFLERLENPKTWDEIQ